MLTDLKMAEMDGMALMNRLHKADPDLPVVMMTGFASIESAVAAVREGAFDYLPKSFSADRTPGRGLPRGAVLPFRCFGSAPVTSDCWRMPSSTSSTSA